MAVLCDMFFPTPVEGTPGLDTWVRLCSLAGHEQSRGERQSPIKEKKVDLEEDVGIGQAV